MAKKTKGGKVDELITVRIKRSVLDLVHENKKVTRVPVSAFIEVAILEKLGKK